VIDFTPLAPDLPTTSSSHIPLALHPIPLLLLLESD
jgi:hypothetical protein